MTKKRDLRTVMGALLISPLPKAVRDALLADRAFLSKLDITPQYSFHLTADLSGELGSLHAALRAAISGRKTAYLRLADKSRVRAKLRLRKNGHVSLELKARAFSFTDADLLSNDKAPRLRALKRVLKAKPLLHAEQCEWQAIANQRPFTDHEHLTLMTALGATPEALTEVLSGPQSLDVNRLMPDDVRYYDRLLAPLGASRDLQGFITNELDAARRALIKSNRRHALRRIAYSALWQPLIPFDALSSFASSEVSALLESEDPFSLIFGFEMCRAFLPKDPAYAELGTRFLEKLVAKQGESRARCNLFCACVTVAMINVRRVAKALSAPVFWVRLAALTHAGVLAHALRGLSNSEDFLKWSIENFGPQYIWHGMIDRREAPRWRPDWISPNHIYAELVGRAVAALNMLEKGNRPAEWVVIIDRALEELGDANQVLSAFFPGPFDDFHPTLAVPDNPFFKEVESALQGASRLSDAHGLFGLGYSILPSQQLLAEVLRIVSAPLDQPIADEDTELLYLGLAAHMAACGRSEPLAQAVINRCLFLARIEGSRAGAADLFAVIAEACAAHSDPKLHRALLSEAASQLAFAVRKPEAMSQLESVFNMLGQRDPKLISALGRASAILRTGLAG
jgi:hypothetical protein